jgi:CarD family transcriptional regulator
VKFQVGATVVYPSHGTARVVARTKRELDGKAVPYVELEVAGPGDPRQHGAMRLMVPEGRAEDLGVRDVIGPDEVEEVLTVLSARNVRVPSNWSRRFKNHQEKLKSGDIYQVAEVVRNLSVRSKASSSGLSAAEKSMQERARRILASELAVSWDIPYEQAEARMDGAAGGAG